MVVSFCIKEPLDLTRVHQIELKFSKFPGGGAPYPPNGRGPPPPIPIPPPPPPVSSADGRRHFMPSLAGSISKLTGRQIS